MFYDQTTEADIARGAAQRQSLVLCLAWTRSAVEFAAGTVLDGIDSIGVPLDRLIHFL